MSKRDYAKVQAPSKSDSAGDASVLPAIAIVVVAVICFVGGYWLGGEKAANNVSGVAKSDLDAVQSKLDSELAASKLLQVNIDELQEQIELLQKRAGQGAHTKLGDLRFYSELPKQSVTPAPVADTRPAPARVTGRTTPEMPETAPVATQATAVPGHGEPGKETHKVQIASFKTKSEAANMQKKLMKVGISSFVRRVDLTDRGQWFRVFAGPYADRDSARAAVKDIQKKTGIRGMLVRGN